MKDGSIFDGSGKAPVGLVDASGRAFSAPRYEELAKTEYEFLQPDGAEPALYTYEVEAFAAGQLMMGVHAVARRYWALKRYLLVGGTIRDGSDALHLAHHFGVTHVLSFESEATDHGKWSQDKRAEVPIPDDNRPPPLELMIRTVKWVKELPKSGVVLYCHCHLGGHRGPVAAYLALRVRWQMDRAAAQKYAGRKPGGDPLSVHHLNTVDKAILAVCGR